VALHLILGRAGSGKTWHCLASARQSAASDPKGPPLILLVPEQATHQTERAVLTGPGAPGATTRVSVLSFRRLAMRVLEATGGASLPLLDALGRQMLLASIVERRRADLRIFGGSARRPGFVRRLANTLAELAAQRVGTADLAARRDALRDAGNQNQLLAGKLHDLCILAGDYEQAIQDVYLDPHSSLDVATVRVAAAGILRGATVFVDGFAGFTAQEYDLLAAIMAVAADVHVALCLDPAEVLAPGATEPGPDEPRLFSPTLKTYWRLRSLAAERQVRLGPTLSLPRSCQPIRYAAPALAHLEAWWSSRSVGPQAPAAARAVRIVSATDERHEVAATAAEICRLARQRGYAWRDIAVLVPDLEAYHDLLRVSFAAAGIPLFIDRRRPVPYHPLVEFVRSAVEVATSNWASAPVTRWLKTDLGPIARSDADRLENFILATGVRGDRWTSDAPWWFGQAQLVQPGTGDPGVTPDDDRDVTGETTPAAHGAADAAACDDLRRQVAAVLGPAVARLRMAIARSVSASDLVAALVELLAAAGLPAQIQAWSEAARLEGDLDGAQEHREVWDGVVRVLEQLHAALGGQRMRLAEFASVLAAGLESLELGMVPPSLDQVVCGTVERSRQPDLKAMFVLGAKLGTLPGAPQQDLVFDDAERSLLSDPGLGPRPLQLAAPASERAFHEDYLTYIALTRSSEYLWVSYPQRAGGLAGVSPSPVVARLTGLLPDLALEMIDETAIAPSPAALAREAVGHLAGVRHGLPLPDRWAQVYSWLVATEARREALRPIFAGLGWGNDAVPVRRQQAAALYGRPIRASATRLEQFARCPYAHFAGQGLRLEARPLRQVEAPEIGSFYHSLLQRYFGQLQRAGQSLARMDDASLDESLRDLFDAVAGQLERAVWGDTGRLRHLVLLLQRAIGRTVRQLSEHARRSQFEPLGMEISFGLPGSPRPALDLGPIIVRGVIDRIDAALVEGCLLLRVMDYKTGRPQFSLAKVAQGISLQLPIYLAAVLQFARELAAQAGLTGPEAADLQVRVAAMFLFPVQDPMVVMDDWDDLELAKALAKRWRPSGLVLNDPAVLLILDEEAADAATQRLLPVRLTKAGAVSGQGAVSEEQMAMLGAFAANAAQLTAARLRAGDTALRPYRDGNRRACEICDFHAVCAFDPQLPGNVYRDLPSMPAAQAWAAIEAALAAAGGEGAK